MATRKILMRAATVGLVGAFLVATAWAAGEAGGILFPNWSKPTKGTYKVPASEVGKKVTNEQPWSVTTQTSSIDNRPLKGKAVTVVGEIIDLSCYMQVGKHGDKHRDCGQKCIKAGQPVGLLAENGDVYLLMDEEHDPRRDGMTELRKTLIDNMANVVTLNGTFSEVEGQKAIYVQGSVKK